MQRLVSCYGLNLSGDGASSDSTRRRAISSLRVTVLAEVVGRVLAVGTRLR
jgi:hypothetical protein